MAGGLACALGVMQQIVPVAVADKCACLVLCAASDIHKG